MSEVHTKKTAWLSALGSIGGHLTHLAGIKGAKPQLSYSVKSTTGCPTQ